MFRYFFLERRDGAILLGDVLQDGFEGLVARMYGGQVLVPGMVAGAAHRCFAAFFDGLQFL